MTTTTKKRRTTAPEFCTIDGCDRPHAGRGYCQPHYKRWYRYGDPLGTPEVQQPRLLTADVVEDLDWMAQHGETLAGAADRISKHTDIERTITPTELYDVLRNGPHRRLAKKFSENTRRRDGGDA